MPDSRWKLVSIRTLCGEGDGRRGKAERHQFQHFYPRPPQGGRPTIRRWTMPSGQFLSTPSARRATCAVTAFRKQLQIISIHALREEGDRPQAQVQSKADNFYPRPPRGGRPSRCCGTRSSTRFLSTPSARRATCWPPPPCLRPVISIHALREEGDSLLPPRPAACPNFYPRHPRGGRPFPDSSGTLRWPYFYPRHPRGGRQFAKAVSLEAIKFLSTPSARRATPRICEVGNIKKDFYPRPPRGGRRSSPSAKASRPEFLSTPSARRATYKPDGRCNISGISIHALREEGDLLFR